MEYRRPGHWCRGMPALDTSQLCPAVEVTLYTKNPRNYGSIVCIGPCTISTITSSTLSVSSDARFDLRECNCIYHICCSCAKTYYMLYQYPNSGSGSRFGAFRKHLLLRTFQHFAVGLEARGGTARIEQNAARCDVAAKISGMLRQKSSLLDDLSPPGTRACCCKGRHRPRPAMKICLTERNKGMACNLLPAHVVCSMLRFGVYNHLFLGYCIYRG